MKMKGIMLIVILATLVVLGFYSLIIKEYKGTVTMPINDAASLIQEYQKGVNFTPITDGGANVTIAYKFSSVNIIDDLEYSEPLRWKVLGVMTLCATVGLAWWARRDILGRG